MTLRELLRTVPLGVDMDVPLRVIAPNGDVLDVEFVAFSSHPRRPTELVLNTKETQP